MVKFFILLTLAYIAWGAYALHVAHDQQQAEAEMLITQARYRACPPAVAPRQGAPLMPNDKFWNYGDRRPDSA